METLQDIHKGLTAYLTRIRPYLFYAAIITIVIVFPISFSVSVTIGDKTFAINYDGESQDTASHTLSMIPTITQTDRIIHYEDEYEVTPSIAEVPTPVEEQVVEEPEEEDVFILELFEPSNRDQTRLQAFIERFHRIAQIEEDKYGIPASITLAQALLESNVGRSSLTVEHNNYFGVKCTPIEIREGTCTIMEDDTPTDNFRVYTNAWESFRHHSEVLQKPRYQGCYDSPSYVEWCDCLSESGYATDPQYSSKLQSLIRTYRLYQFDA